MVSTRRKETVKNRAYKAGDKVEVVRPDGIEVGTLLYKMSRNRSASSPQSVPHWKVSIGDGNVSDDNSSEDVSEHMLGRVLKQSTAVNGGLAVMDSANSSDTSSPEPLPSAVATGKKKRGGKQKTVTIVAPPTPPPAAAAKATGGRRRGGRVKAAPKGKRPAAAKYSRKEAPVVAVATAPAASTTTRGKATTTVTKSSPRTGARAGTRSNAANDILTGIDDISRITPAVAGQKKKQLQQSKRKEQRQLRHMAVGEETTSVNKFGETVIKVKLLTGTLFIYKGNADGTAKRRAEFVRSK